MTATPVTAAGRALDLEELRRLAEGATPGPWRVRRGQWGRDSGRYRYVAFSAKQDESYTTSPLEAADAYLIAAANPKIILALLDRLREAEARQAAPLDVERLEAVLAASDIKSETFYDIRRNLTDIGLAYAAATTDEEGAER